MLELVEETAKLIFRFVFAVLFFWTGEIILFLLSFGKHKARWSFYAEETPFRFVVFSDISEWIGMAFWILLVAAVWYLLSVS